MASPGRRGHGWCGRVRHLRSRYRLAWPHPHPGRTRRPAV